MRKITLGKNIFPFFDFLWSNNGNVVHILEICFSF